MDIDCATVKENLPAVFKEKLFVDCTEFRCEVPKVHLMDCTEFRCEVPKDPSKQSELDVCGDASSPNDALSPRGGSSPNNYLPPDKNIAGTNATQEVNVTVSKSSTRNKKKDVVVIAGDSLVKNMVGAYMSKDDVGHHYVVKAFPVATVEDMEDFIKPITRKSPNKVILHVGTNDLKKSTPKVIADSILNLTTQIKEDSPSTMVIVSALLDRNDCPKLATKVKQVNIILDNYCQVNKIPFLRNANINTSHLNRRGLNLNKLGSLSLQNNVIEFTNNLDH